jgi:hypothetical protein
VDTVRVEVTENDIVRAIKNTELSPVRLALCRSLNCDDDSLDIHKNEIRLWIYDEADHFTYRFRTEEDRDNFNEFTDQWLVYTNDQSIESFDENPFTFDLNAESDSKTGSVLKIVSNIDYDKLTDRPSSDRKNPKFRLTDDDE